MRELHSLPSPSATRRPRRRAAALVAVLAAAGVLAACSSSSTNPSITASGPAPSESVAAAEGTPSPSPTAAESPSAAATADASAAAAAASFAASVSAQQTVTGAKAATVLAALPGGGNAIGSVTVDEVPLRDSGGLPAAVVTVENGGLNPASYAVQVDFTDTSGKTVDSAMVGVEALPAGEQASSIAFSRTPAQQRLLPVVVKAYSY
ncbi:hypothetical protein ACFYUY_30115 [Kitasatospora sp. NPDC004745]|uniref:hypothetical protein n=1 Tax=unclassified Kitasatospora TaxID=2633591 RepID=UPI0033E87944